MSNFRSIFFFAVLGMHQIPYKIDPNQFLLLQVLCWSFRCADCTLPPFFPLWIPFNGTKSAPESHRRTPLTISCHLIYENLATPLADVPSRGQIPDLCLFWRKRWFHPPATLPSADWLQSAAPSQHHSVPEPVYSRGWLGEKPAGLKLHKYLTCYDAPSTQGGRFDVSTHTCAVMNGET